MAASSTLLEAEDHEKLKTFLETRLISSRVDQKLKNKRRKYMLLKREIRLEIVGDVAGRGRGIEASVDAVCTEWR